MNDTCLRASVRCPSQRSGSSASFDLRLEFQWQLQWVWVGVHIHDIRVFSQRKCRHILSRRKQVRSNRCLSQGPFKMLFEKGFPWLKTSLKALEKTIPKTLLHFSGSSFLSSATVPISPKCSRSTADLTKAQNGLTASSKNHGVQRITSQMFLEIVLVKQPTICLTQRPTCGYLNENFSF